MLAAVGLLLASLALGAGPNLVRALGGGTGANEAGICGYSDLMLNAILDHNEDSSYECDSNYRGAGPFWGNGKDLDLSNKGLSAFAPGKGELDGFHRGARVDLRGNGLTVADIDVSDAKDPADADEASTQFGPTLNGLTTDAGQNLGLTFLLDGGSESANGLAAPTYEVTEGGTAWITFQYGDKPEAFGKVEEGDDKGAWARVTLSIETETAGTAGRSQVSILINSKDADGTLYAVPFTFPDDTVIEKDRDFDVEIDNAVATNDGLVSVGTFAEATADAGTTDQTFTATAFNKGITRGADDSDLRVIDNDTPAVLVADRQDAVEEAIALLVRALTNQTPVDLSTISTKKISVGHLAALTTLTIGKSNANVDGGDPISSISPGDLSGLTNLASLDLSGNDLTELPSGLFADVGSKTPDAFTMIDVTGNDGPTDEGFTLANIGAVGDELLAGQVLTVDGASDDDAAGFLHSSYEAVEDGVLVVDVNITDADSDTAGFQNGNAAIQFISSTGDSGTLQANKTDDKPADVKADILDLSGLSAGHHRIAIGLPENDKEDGDNTLTALFGRRGAADTTTPLASVLSIAPVTIRDASYMAPPPAPTSSFESVVVTQNEYVEAPGNEDLKHNISNLTVTVGGSAVSANFLDVYNATGGLERWGYPTSELVEIPGIGLTQFFQRGALHLESNAEVTRLLAWDYVGGGMGGSTDQGVEAAPDSAPEGGEQVGAFGHYVANVDADGNATGFLDFFNRLGGVAAFGFPKTEAREDTGAEGTLMEPGTTAGFTRQYFQAAVFQLAEDGSVQLTLLGDTLRGILVPGYADMDAFGAADALSVGDSVSPPLIS